ncbi:hypothetical protein PsorP6_008042 [Peronosclerospora sorghi]|uniref:Uncharacterized protein n=1 Tax=Peronosclerospora sorghi TaxID=230839 RepID=A0ACC0WAC8_9STRA|nr:hypothetical protein PsorP6_008042 [Peronosclerospora sorghi]
MKSRLYAESLEERSRDVITVRLATGVQVTVPKVSIDLKLKFEDFDSLERCLWVKHSSDFADVDAAAVHKLPGRSLLPGMVNAHSDAFQRGMRGLGEVYPKHSVQRSFWTWREEMYKLVDGMNEQ